MPSNSPPILVTGALGGFGRQCVDYFRGTPFSRQTNFADILADAKSTPYDAIIHAAFQTSKAISDANLYSYLADNLFLTQKLLKVPHKKFIFISTVDVYPKNELIHQEDEQIPVKEVESIYGVSKLMCESIVKNETSNFLILRPTALLGQYAKKNSLMKIVTENNVELTLSAQSQFNYVLHTDICRFIEAALCQDLTGIYNIAASTNVCLGTVAASFNASVKFGAYTYLSGLIDNQRARAVLPDLNRSSLASIQQYLSACPANTPKNKE